MASLVKSSATIGFYTLISRVLGFARDVTIAAALGASMLADAFFVAFKIPNFLRRLFAEGAFNSAFVPLYAGAIAGDGQQKANEFASEAYSFLVTILLALSMVCVIAMPWLMHVLAPGFSANPEKFELTVLLTQITFPYIIFISVVSLLGGILNSLHKFAAVAATPILMNLCLIIVPWAIADYTPTMAHGLAISVFVAGLAQMLWLMFFCWKLKVLPRLRYPRLSAEVKRMLKLIAPAALGAGVAQINLFIDLIIASTIASGVSYLYYADRINELPLAVIGIAVGTVLLPSLSKLVREGKTDEVAAMQNRAIEFALLLVIPAAAAIIMLAAPLVHVLYERGAFTAVDAAATTPALMAFACGLPAFVLIKVLTPSFYANQDTKTPFKIAMICIGANLALNLILIGPFKHVGMAMATSIAGWLNVVLILNQLKLRNLFAIDGLMVKRIPRIVLAAMVMCAGLWLLKPYVAPFFAEHFAIKFAALLMWCAAGCGLYFAVAWQLKLVEIAKFKRKK
jgi:putative peptidoglycan lipid II flippase